MNENYNDGTLLDYNGINLENQASLASIMNTLNYFNSNGINIGEAKLITQTHPAVVGFDSQKTHQDNNGLYHTNAKELGDFLRQQLKDELKSEGQQILARTNYYPDNVSLDESSNPTMSPAKKFNRDYVIALQTALNKISQSDDIEEIEKVMDEFNDEIKNIRATQNTKTTNPSDVETSIDRFMEIRGKYKAFIQHKESKVSVSPPAKP